MTIEIQDIATKWYNIAVKYNQKVLIMDIPYLFPICLTLHLLALATTAGGTLAEYVAYAAYWSSLKRSEDSAALRRLMDRLARLIGLGGAVLILSGIGMMALTNGIFGEQLWFRIKFALVILLILNGLLVGRRLGIRLRKTADNNASSSTIGLSGIRSRLNRFHLSQLVLFLLIIFLSAFKFN